VPNPSVKRSIHVCLLSSHAYFLTQFANLLDKAGFRAELCRLGGNLPTNLNSIALPVAAVYVLDAPVQAQATLASHVLGRSSKSKLVVLAETFDENTAFPLLGMGVKGLLAYSEATEQLPRALDAVTAGGYWVPRNLLARFVDWILGQTPGHGKRISMANISPREQQILQALLQNHSNKEIADQLHISERTVKFHVSNLLSKCGVQRRADLILLVFQQGSAGFSTVQ
jgi:DNA-binding NarL/FixJ family response regulator